MKHQLAGCCGSINVLRNTFKRNALLFECRYCLYQMLEGSAKPVKPPDNEGVTLAKVRERLNESRPLFFCPGDRISEDVFCTDASFP
jgi:hypothetical protein